MFWFQSPFFIYPAYPGKKTVQQKKQLYTNTKVENYDRRKDVIGSIHLPAHSLSLILILLLKLICLILMFVIFLFKSGLLYVCMFSSLINCFQIVNQCFQFSWSSLFFSRSPSTINMMPIWRNNKWVETHFWNSLSGSHRGDRITQCHRLLIIIFNQNKHLWWYSVWF